MMKSVTGWKRWSLVVMLAGVAWAQQGKKEAPQEPPEEDETLKTKEYGFNPLQAAKEIKIGLYYEKKKNHRAAASRFLEATKWDPTSAEAWLRLGGAREKLKDKDGAVEAYRKYLEAAPDAKDAAEIRKKIGQE